MCLQCNVKNNHTHTNMITVSVTIVRVHRFIKKKNLTDFIPLKKKGLSS